MRVVTSEPQPATTQPIERCAVCGTEIPDLGIYCPNCGATKPSMVGRPPPYAPSWMRTGPPAYPDSKSVPSVRSIFKAFAAIIILTLVAWVLFTFITMLAGIGIVAPDIQDHSIGTFHLFVAVPYLVSFAALSGTGLLVYYFFLIAATAASLAWVLATSARGYFKELILKAEPRNHSPIFEIGALMFATLFLQFAIVIVTGAANSNTPVSNETNAQLLFSLANAPVWEEIIVRVLMIGVPLLFIDLIRRKFRKDWYRYFLGGSIKIGIPETALIIFSATMFGFAHYLGGWGEWKIPAAGIAGLAFGYLFLKFGLAASITLHFMFDYMSAPELVFTSTNFEPVLAILLLLWLGAGAIFTGYYIVRIIEHFTGTKFWERRPQPIPWGVPYAASYQPAAGPPAPYRQEPQTQSAPGAYQPSYPPPPQIQGMYGYTCPVCGNLQARWVNGKFQCLRCGHLS